MAEKLINIPESEAAKFEAWKKAQEKYKVDGRRYTIETSLYVLKAKAAGIKVTKEEVDKVYASKFPTGK